MEWNSVEETEVKVFEEEIDTNEKMSELLFAQPAHGWPNTAGNQRSVRQGSLQTSATGHRQATGQHDALRQHGHALPIADKRTRGPPSSASSATATARVSRRHRSFGSGSVQVTRAENCVQGGAAVERLSGRAARWPTIGGVSRTDRSPT